MFPRKSIEIFRRNSEETNFRGNSEDPQFVGKVLGIYRGRASSGYFLGRSSIDAFLDIYTSIDRNIPTDIFLGISSEIPRDIPRISFSVGMHMRSLIAFLTVMVVVAVLVLIATVIVLREMRRRKKTLVVVVIRRLLTCAICIIALLGFLTVHIYVAPLNRLPRLHLSKYTTRVPARTHQLRKLHYRTELDYEPISSGND
ncbi:hypothetical protein DY000_02046177 [Brassica cretica]|uniref:Uncharacterized protein n=1 Tax=Brassica cretica TaxID=69181 RepID=A0ABQ7EQL2_BRACR|nr:hypothetical protein DY000_02046177 [Brassica cretica]